MAQVEVQVNGQPYLVACEDGQEARLAELAQVIDAEVRDLVRQVGQVGQARLLLMTCLQAMDELIRLRDELDARRTGSTEEAMADQIEQMAQRLEAIAGSGNQT